MGTYLMERQTTPECNWCVQQDRDQMDACNGIHIFYIKSFSFVITV